MFKILPAKLQSGDQVRIIAPSRSLAIISPDLRHIAQDRFAQLGLKLSFGQHVEEIDGFNSSSIESRIDDLHQAFADPSIKAILTVIGGFNANQLLEYIDWQLIRRNPKIFCGYSDITVLNNALFAQTGLVTYSGPHYSTFGQELYFDHTLDYFKKCLMSEDKFKITASSEWSDDRWFIDQKDRKLMPNTGHLVINQGTAEGTILGANLCTFNLLQGTAYMPDIKEAILFLEDDAVSQPHTFDRDLQSLIHLPEFKYVRGLVIGRFQNDSQMTEDLLRQIIKTKKPLAGIPVIAGVDFGHTDPKITFPIGGTASLVASQDLVRLIITKH